MHEKLQLTIYRIAYFAYLVERQLPLKNQAPETHIFQHPGLLWRADGALRGGMQLYRRQLHTSDTKVLHYQCVHPGIVQLPYHPLRLPEFILKDDGVHGGVDFRREFMGIGCQRGDVFHRISRNGTRPETGPGDIYGIGTAVNRRDADVFILRRS